MRVVVLGARGFVGSAFARLFKSIDAEVLAVDRASYAGAAGTSCDVLVNAAGNSAKFIADRDPARDFEQSVSLALRAAFDFRPAIYLLVSSVDVYADLSNVTTTTEDSAIDPMRASTYGFHKRLAELCVQRHARRWLVVRLAGMVGPGLRKNPVYDILHEEPLRIHPDSQYQFMTTDEAAASAWHLVSTGVSGDVFNVCGHGLISPSEIARLAGRHVRLSPEAERAGPRIVDVSIDKISRVRAMPSTRETIRGFVEMAANVP